MGEPSYARAAGVRIAYERTGSGTPLLLLHGWPQTRRIWRRVVRGLSDRFDCITADLRGYGDSAPAADPATYDKRTMAEDMLALMDEIGVGGRFLVVGHDRGARVARRLAADHPDRLCGAALIDVMPLEWVYEQGPDAHALRYAHWYFHLQRGLAEELIGARPEQYARHYLARSHVALDPGDVEHYVRQFSRPEGIAATLADYRTAFHVDRRRWLADVAAGRRVEVPLLVLWGDRGNLTGDLPVLDEWRARATDVRGHMITGSGHYVPEEQPKAVIAAVRDFADELGLP